MRGDEDFETGDIMAAFGVAFVTFGAVIYGFVLEGRSKRIMGLPRLNILDGSVQWGLSVASALVISGIILIAVAWRPRG